MNAVTTPLRTALDLARVHGHDPRRVCRSWAGAELTAWDSAHAGCALLIIGTDVAT